MKECHCMSAEIPTPLGNMIAIANEDALLWLSFKDSVKSNAALSRFLEKQKATLVDKPSSVLALLVQELALYFQHQLTQFTIPLDPQGTAFQRRVWQALQTITHGETCSYATLAANIQHKTAYRAVAQANAANPISLIIPCHRVINHNGQLGGYSGGMDKKIELLAHESNTGIAARH